MHINSHSQPKNRTANTSKPASCDDFQPASQQDLVEIGSSHKSMIAHIGMDYYPPPTPPREKSLREREVEAQERIARAMERQAQAAENKFWS